MINATEVIFKDIEQNEEYEILAEKVMHKCFEIENITFGFPFLLQIQKILDKSIKNIEILIKRQMYYLFQCMKKKN